MLVAFVKENVRILTPPCCATFPIFTDDDSELNTSATIASLAPPTQLEHPVTQFVMHNGYRGRWRCRRIKLGRDLCSAILRRDSDPCSVVALTVAAVLIVVVATRPRFALRSDSGSSRPTDDCTYRSPE